MRTLSVAVLVALLAAPAPARADEVKKTEKTEWQAPPPAASDSGGNAFHASGGLFDTADQKRPHVLSVMLIVPSWYYGIGLGFGLRYTLPIVPNGFIPSLNDSFELEFGGDAYYVPTYAYDSLLGIAGHVGARYTFHFTSKFDAYLRVAVGVQYRHFSTNYNSWSGADFFYFDAGPGAEYKVLDMLVLRAEVSYSGLRIGAGFTF